MRTADAGPVDRLPRFWPRDAARYMPDASELSKAALRLWQWVAESYRLAGFPLDVCVGEAARAARDAGEMWTRRWRANDNRWKSSRRRRALERTKRRRRKLQAAARLLRSLEPRDPHKERAKRMARQAKRLGWSGRRGIPRSAVPDRYSNGEGGPDPGG